MNRLHTQNLISFALNLHPNPKPLIFHISPFYFHKFTNFAIAVDRHKPYRFSPAMESHNFPAADFVHIRNPFQVLDQQKNEDLYANHLTEEDLSANRLTVEDVFANQEKNEDLLANRIIGDGKEDEGVHEPNNMNLSANQENNEDLSANQIIGEGVDELKNEDLSANHLIDEGLSANHVIGEDLFANREFGEMYEKKILPEELSKSVMLLSCESSAEGGSCEVYLVGTAHVSQESCEEVQAVISFLKPQVVFLELCSRRVDVLTPQNLKVPSMREMIEMWKAKQNAFGVLYSWFLAKVSTKLKVFPGSEFRVAYEEAKKYGGKVVLGDRPVQITLGRTWAKMPLWHKTKLVYSLFFQALFLPSSEDLNKMLKEMDDSDMLTLVIQEMSKEFPTLMETLVHERDQYLSSTLLRVAREHSSVVAVVGKGHLRGIKKQWQQPIEIQDLMQMPAHKTGVSPLRVIASLGVAAVGVAIISGIYISSKK